jgi:hypothetical protein
MNPLFILFLSKIEIKYEINIVLLKKGVKKDPWNF